MSEVTVPDAIREYADQAVAYVRRALGLALEYDSNTLPLLDHYLKSLVSDDEKPATLQLVIATSGAYFGEVVRRLLGGRWEQRGTEWRIVLPTGLNFAPAGFVAAAIARNDLEDLDSALEAPPRLRPHVEQAMQRMGDVSEDDYYSLCGRLDTIEHIHEVLVAVAAQMLGDTDSDSDDEAEPVATDEPSGPVN